MLHLYSPYAELLLEVLRAEIPCTCFAARLAGGTTCQTLWIYVLGVRHSGQVLGGYALCYAPGTSDILEDGVMLVKFFRSVQAADAAVFEPPALAAWWNHTPLRRIMFPDLNAVDT